MYTISFGIRNVTEIDVRAALTDTCRRRNAVLTWDRPDVTCRLPCARHIACLSLAADSCVLNSAVWTTILFASFMMPCVAQLL